MAAAPQPTALLLVRCEYLGPGNLSTKGHDNASNCKLSVSVPAMFPNSEPASARSRQSSTDTPTEPSSSQEQQRQQPQQPEGGPSTSATMRQRIVELEKHQQLRLQQFTQQQTPTPAPFLASHPLPPHNTNSSSIEQQEQQVVPAPQVVTHRVTGFHADRKSVV